MTDKVRHTAAQQASLSGAEVAAANSPLTLRRLAEARLSRNAAPTPQTIESMSSDEVRKMLHELQVHQVELLMQNEELRGAQEALDVERARYFDLYDLAPVGYCTISEQGLIMQANLTAASLLGTPRSELLKQPWSRFVHKEDEDRYYLRRKALVESGEPQSCELRVMKKDGTHFWAHWTASVARDSNGKIELRAVLSDITVRKSTEQALKESGEHYHNLFTSIDEGICVIDMIFDERGKPVDYRFLEMNPSFEKQCGLHQATGKRIRELVPNLEPHWYEIYGKVALTGEPVRIEGKVRDMGGRCFDIYASRLGGPESRKIAIVFNDTTDRMNAEIKLREAKEVADKANSAKSEFLSSMSHELRTPLNAILGFGQLIEAGTPPPTPTQKRNVEHILKAGWYLLTLVDEILDLALIDSGTLSLSMGAVSLEEVMRECQAMVEHQAEAREIRMSFPCFEAPCHVNADRNRVKQVLSNLLSNAIKYNRPAGSVVVDWVVSPAGRIRISVTDTGDGLPSDKLAQLFQPFNRLGKETSAVQGTGIGLVVSKRIVEMMDGVIGVESTVGKGSVFWFELNPAISPQPVVGAAKAATIVPAPSQIDAPLRTLLYVEDNPANLTLVEEIISHRPDIRLLTAIDGESGIEIARAAFPDVILMDINLPGISGIEALKILAENPATARIPVVALSANAMAGYIETCLAAGFFRYLTKPIKFNEFMDTLDNAQEYSIAAARRTSKKEQA